MTQDLNPIWTETGSQTPVSKVGQELRFTIGSGSSSQSFVAPIVPEPNTATLLGLGFVALAGIRRRQARSTLAGLSRIES